MSQPKEIYIDSNDQKGSWCAFDIWNSSTKYHHNDVVEDLKAKLLIAAQYIEDWGAYADDYFQKKHELSADIKEIREAAE